MWMEFASKKIVLAAGLGPPGGPATQGFSLSTRYGGPRWWPFSGDNGMDDFIRSQVRYHPEFIHIIGEAAEIPDEGWETIKQGNFFIDKDPYNINVMAVQDGDSKEKAVLLLIDEQNGEFRVEDLPFEAEDIVKQLKNWEFKILVDQEGKSRIVGKEINSGGNKKGIFEVNRGHSVPGFYYIFQSERVPNPSDQLHGDLSSFEWNRWRNEGGQPGM